MDRPAVTSVDASNIKLSIPPGWSATINAVNRKGYNQLFTCQYEIGGIDRTNAFANKWQTPNSSMVDIDTDYDLIGLIPQPEGISLDMQFYYSEESSVRRDALQADKYKSAQATVLKSSKPPRAPVDFPDYVTFIMLVQDSPLGEQAAGQPSFDDMVATINCIHYE